MFRNNNEPTKKEKNHKLLGLPFHTFQQKQLTEKNMVNVKNMDIRINFFLIRFDDSCKSCFGITTANTQSLWRSI